MKAKIIRGILIILAIFTLPILCLAQEPGEAFLPQFAVTGPSIISLPLEASPFTGEAFTSVPIVLMPSAGNIQEKISLGLQYRSGGGNSWVGRGWELELGYIAKINKFGANNSNNPYILVLNGQSQELVAVGTNQYRTKIESNMRIEFTGSAWLVYDRDGTQYRFGISAAGRWVLDKITDIHGISLSIEYDRPYNGEIYLKGIRYPEGSGLSPYCKVSFISEDRNDKIITYYYGSLFKVNRRLKEIQILVDGCIQKRYVLTYTTDGTSQVSLLKSVTEYGKDGQALPPISFSYQQPLRSNIIGNQEEWLPDTESFYTHQVSYSTDLGPVPAGIDTAVIDLNNDNLPDLIGCIYLGSYATSPYKSKWVAHLNTGNGFSSREDVWAELDNPEASGEPVDKRVPITLTRNATLVDMNKDGLPDLVYSKFGGRVTANNTRAYNIFVRYNTGTKFSDTETKLLDYTQAYYTYDGQVSTDTGVIKLGENATLVDINGDGLPDLLYHRQRKWESWSVYDLGYIINYYLTFDLAVRLNTGSGFSSEEKIWLTNDKTYFKYSYKPSVLCYGPPIANSYIVEFICLNKNAAFVDMNNDGLVDLVYNDYAEPVSEFYSGTVICGTWSYPSYNWKVRYNTGEKFSDAEFTYLSSAPVFIYTIHPPPYDFIKGSSVRIGENGTLADINNDGLPDLIFNEYKRSDSGSYETKTPWTVCFNLGNKFASPVKLYDSLDYDYTYNQGTKRGNVVTRNSSFIDVNKDGVIDLAYPQFIEWESRYSNTQPGKASFKILIHRNKGLLSTDLLTRQTSSFGGKTDISYVSSANFDNNGGDGKNDLTFIMPLAKTVTKNPEVGDSGTTYYSYEGGWYDIPNREFRGFRRVRTTDPLGFVTQTLFHQDDSRLGKVESQENSITKTVNNYKTDTTAPYFTPLIQVDEYMNSKVKRISYDYDSYGNVIKTIFYGDTAASGDEKSIFTDYCLNTSSWLVNLPSRERLFANTSGSGSAVAETQYFYDSHSNYTDVPTKGDLTQVKRYLNTKSTYIQTASSYDSYGNEISKTDANGNTTNIQYDSTYHSFPITITNAKGHIERNTYYLPTVTKGLFGQLKSKIDANGNEASLEYDGFGRKTKVIGPYDLSSTYGSESYKYEINGPGANYILTRTTEENGTTNHFIKVDILDGFERVIQTAKESEETSIYSYITTSYNPRGEVAQVSLPYFENADLPTCYITPSGSVKWTQYTYDAIGRITRITKPDTGIINNSYSGWTTTVTDENNHQKTFIKDAYDRLISAKEKKATEEYTTNYKYDALDSLTLITDHLGNKFEFFYDSLNRKTKMIDPDLGTWTYDYDNNGNIIKITSGKGEVINFTYDSLNRVITKDYASQQGIEVTYKYDETTSTNGIGRRTGMQDLSGSSNWGYDNEGRVTKLSKTIDANAYILEWTYDAMDRIKSILFPNLKRADFRYNNAGLVEAIDGFMLDADYNASSQPTTITFSNPMVTRFDYYPENQRLKSILTGSLQDLRYEYDKVGNIIKITDAVRSYTKGYIYDDLDRLISGDSNTYEYNAIGNIAKVNGIAQSYSSPKVHALTSDGINTYSYDSCGNMIAGAGRSISYDPENRPITITKNGKTTQFVYDGDGKRVKKIVNNGQLTATTIYIEDLYEKEVTQ